MLCLIGTLIVANTGAAGRLVGVVLGSGKIDGAPIAADRLLVAGSLVLASNVVTFALLYWQLDGGGPAQRDSEPKGYPDFVFTQTAMPHLAPAGWRSHFADYVYLSYTNLVAFSPSDTLPLTIRAKVLMTIQSLISLAVLVVVLARVINILPP
jgi:uncharacterized membrane protein